MWSRSGSKRQRARGWFCTERVSRATTSRWSSAGPSCCCRSTWVRQILLPLCAGWVLHQEPTHNMWNKPNEIGRGSTLLYGAHMLVFLVGYRQQPVRLHPGSHLRHQRQPAGRQPLALGGDRTLPPKRQLHLGPTHSALQDQRGVWPPRSGLWGEKVTWSPVSLIQSFPGSRQSNKPTEF